jgi:hypothetical protein
VKLPQGALKKILRVAVPHAGNTTFYFAVRLILMPEEPERCAKYDDATSVALILEMCYTSVVGLMPPPILGRLL